MGDNWRVVEADSRREWKASVVEEVVVVAVDSMGDDSAQGRVENRGREGLTTEARA